MRRLAILGLALFYSTHATAATAQNDAWRMCEKDAQCVVVPGPCTAVAVNKDYQNNAAEYFKKQAMLVKCKQQFWQPKLGEAGAKCWMGRCQTVGKD